MSRSAKSYSENPLTSTTGKSGQWSYNLGVASAETNKEFGNFAGGYFGLASAGYDFAPNLGAKKALLRADYVYNQPDAQK